MPKEYRRRSPRRSLLLLALLFACFCWFYYVWYSFTYASAILAGDSEPSIICTDILDSNFLSLPSRHNFHREPSKQPKLDVQHFNIPHPNKAHTGGEDAAYISSDKLTSCVFDGVGGWNNWGIDPRFYSRALVNASQFYVENRGVRDPMSILCHAESNAAHIVGSSTACCITIDGNKLYSATLGDSGYIVVRDEKIIHRSAEQRHEFNYPFQIGTHGDGLDSAAEESVSLEPCDIIVLGTDGLFDNLFEHEIVGFLQEERTGPCILSEDSASRIAQEARIVSLDMWAFSPHMKEAQESGIIFQGGKPDDISVIVIIVTEHTI